jgi:hypothetical protein
MVVMFSTIAVRGVSRGVSAGTKLVWVGEGAAVGWELEETKLAS